ncbi:MAG: helix-turn-helix transcriptional regulator [Chloroflexi bacterium]|nr:helix-turn-helix transcriptional regulator [Chloroflexota bacterium]
MAAAGSPLSRDGGQAFGALLQRHRLAAGLSQAELAERAGLSQRGISDLERGLRRAPYPATLRRLAEALGLAEPERTALLAAGRGGSWLPAVGTSLPAPVGELLGRQHELALAGERLADGARLLTLTGAGRGRQDTPDLGAGRRARWDRRCGRRGLRRPDAPARGGPGADNGRGRLRPGRLGWAPTSGAGAPGVPARPAHAAAAGQLRAGVSGRAVGGAIARRRARAGGAGHQPRAAPAAARAGAPRATAAGACPWLWPGPPAAEREPGRAAVRGAGAGGGPELPADRGERAGGGGGVQASGRVAPGDRTGGGAREAVAARGPDRADEPAAGAGPTGAGGRRAGAPPHAAGRPSTGATSC